MPRKFWLFCLVLVLAACQSAPFVPTSTPSPTLPPTPTSSPSPTPFPVEFKGKPIVNGHELEITCKGSGEPTIILENGLNVVDDDSISFREPLFSNLTRSCTYLRWGVGAQPVGDNVIRTLTDQVKDLHDLLHQIGVPGPYILVGHSYAGNIMLLYTNTYPSDVVGLVFADSPHPASDDILLEIIKSEITSDPSFAKTNLAMNRLNPTIPTPDPLDWKNYKEHLDLNSSIKQAQVVTTLGNRPTVALVAQYHVSNPDSRIVKVFDKLWSEMGVRYSKLSSQGRSEVVGGAEHETITSFPEFRKAVTEVYNVVKNVVK